MVMTKQIAAANCLGHLTEKFLAYEKDAPNPLPHANADGKAAEPSRDT
jgi:hypothetical protein